MFVIIIAEKKFHAAESILVDACGWLAIPPRAGCLPAGARCPSYAATFRLRRCSASILTAARITSCRVALASSHHPPAMAGQGCASVLCRSKTCQAAASMAPGLMPSVAAVCVTLCASLPSRESALSVGLLVGIMTPEELRKRLRSGKKIVFITRCHPICNTIRHKRIRIAHKSTQRRRAFKVLAPNDYGAAVTLLRQAARSSDLHGRPA
jgi:hypothetical protein